MSFNSFMHHSMQVENPGTQKDKQGRPILGTTKTIRGRVEITNKTIINKEREREPIDALVYLQPTELINRGSKITYENQEYRVMKIAPMPGRRGKIHHQEIWAQRWSYAA